MRDSSHWNDSVADVVQSDGRKASAAGLIFTRSCWDCVSGIRILLFPDKQLRRAGAVPHGTGLHRRTGKEGCVVYDLYSGTGTIAQMMAPVAEKVIGVEIVEEAVEAAGENAQQNGLSNCEFIAGDVLKVLDEIEEKPDFIILDPPRDGIHPKALQKIIRLRRGADDLYFLQAHQPGKGSWRYSLRADTRWSAPAAWTCFRGRGTWRRYVFCRKLK